MGDILDLIRTHLYYKLIFKDFGEGSMVHGKIRATNPANVSIGKNTSLSHGVIFNSRDKIIIGDGCHISAGAIINTSFLCWDESRQIWKKGKSRVIIKNQAWICSGALLNPGVVIGERAVVGAGAVVTKNVRAGTIVLGIPAKEFKRRG